MKAKNEMRISFPSNSNNEAFGRAVVAAFAAQLDPTIDELSDIKTAVSEAVTNCIVHAYRDTIGMIYITAKYDDHADQNPRQGVWHCRCGTGYAAALYYGRGRTRRFGLCCDGELYGQASRHFETGVWNHRHHAEEPCAACDEEWIGINRYRKTLA